MTIMLDALTVLDEGDSAAEIETKWKTLLAIAGQSEPEDYQRYYPNWTVKGSCSDVQIKGATITAAGWTDFGGQEFLEDFALR